MCISSGWLRYERVLRNLLVLLKSVEIFGFEVGVTAEHLAVAVTHDECDAFDRQIGLKETAGRLVSQIVGLQVIDAQMLASTPKGCADGLRMTEKAAAFAAYKVFC